MLSEKKAFEQLRNSTLSKKDCEGWIDYYTNMKPIWLANGMVKLFKQAWRKDAMRTRYYIDKFIIRGKSLV